MARVYLLIYTNVAASQEKMKEILNSIPEISTWRTDMDQCFYLVSEHDAKTLAQRIRGRTGEHGRFLVAELDPNHWGWLTDDSWYVIQNKQLKPKGAV